MNTDKNNQLVTIKLTTLEEIVKCIKHERLIAEGKDIDRNLENRWKKQTDDTISFLEIEIAKAEALSNQTQRSTGRYSMNVEPVVNKETDKTNPVDVNEVIPLENPVEGSSRHNELKKAFRNKTRGNTKDTFI